MDLRARRTVVLLVLACAALFCSDANALYSITQLPGIIDNTWPADISNRGLVVGTVNVPGPFNANAVRWRGTTLQDLGTMGGDIANGTAVNEEGLVAGASQLAAPPGAPAPVHAFITGGPLSPANDIGTLPGAGYSAARGLNNRGEAVGHSGNGNALHAFLYSGGVMNDLGTLGGATSSATDINDSGAIVGYATTPVGREHAFRTAPWSPIAPGDDLGTLGGYESWAVAVNRNGDVVGASETAGFGDRAFFWSAQKQKMYDLGLLGGGTSGQSSAQDINAWGQVVGSSVSWVPSVSGAFVWSGGLMRDLNALIPAGTSWFLTYATGINDRGQIVGWGSLGGVQAAFRLDDRTAPAVSCGSADGLWHADNVQIACTAQDDESGLAGASVFVLTTNVAYGSWDANALATGPASICDHAGNCTPVPVVSGNRIDRSPPAIALVQPVGSTYLLNDGVLADYTCTDGGSGVGACTGPVASGAQIDTSAVGGYAFTVTAVDQVGNVGVATVSYDVTYEIVVVATPQANVSDLFVVDLADANGNDVSDPGIGVYLQGIDQLTFVNDPFAYVKPGEYEYAVSPKIGTGSHKVYFTVDGDPTLHAAKFVY